MRRASEIRTAGTWNAATAIDRVVLDADERHRRRIALTGEQGTAFLLDLPHATALQDGDGLVLEDGAIVRVAGKPEPLLEVSAASAHELARLAWHIGNRHADVQVVGGTMRIRRDHVLEERGLGARLTPVEAPFDPEHGAYEHHQHGRDLSARSALQSAGHVIAVGVAGAGHGIAPTGVLHAYLHELATNSVSAGVRLVPLGQTDGQRVLARTSRWCRRPPCASSRPGSTVSAARPSALISRACGTRPSTRGCLEAESLPSSSIDDEKGFIWMDARVQPGHNN
jgi:urease accessory protein